MVTQASRWCRPPLQTAETMKHEPKHRSRQSLRGIAVDRFDKIVTDVSIPFASVATFVVGLYSPFMSIWLASGLVVSVSALMFAGIVFLPRARRTRSTVPDSIVRYLFALVLTCGIVMMFVAMVIFGIGVFIWLRFGEYDRVAFAIQEGTPFLILTIVLWVASFGLLRVRLRGWWLPSSDRWGRLRTESIGTTCLPHSYR